MSFLDLYLNGYSDFESEEGMPANGNYEVLFDDYLEYLEFEKEQSIIDQNYVEGG
jgi:hypothetical protein